MRLPPSVRRSLRHHAWLAAALLLGCKSAPGSKTALDAASGSGGAAGAAAAAGGASGATGGASGGSGLGGAAGGATGAGGKGALDAGSSGGSTVSDAAASVDTGPDPGTSGDGDFTIGPTYTISPDLMVQNVPHGRSFTFTMSSTASAIYTGLDPTLLAANQHSFTRQVRVYVPMQYVDGTAAPFMVVQDGFLADISTALDNLIANNRVPAVVAIFVANGGGDSIGSERGLEYDTMSGTYARFIDTEVLPAVDRQRAVKAVYPNFKLDHRSERARRLWLQQRRRRRDDHGLVRAQRLSPPDHLLGHVRRSAESDRARAGAVPGRRLGLCERAHHQRPGAAVARVPAGRRDGQRLHDARVVAAQLAARQPARRRGAQGQGLPLSFHLRARRDPLRCATPPADIAGYTAMDVAGVHARIDGFGCPT